MSQFQLFSTLGCHLCEDAKAILDPLMTHYGLLYKEEEIVEDDEWLAAYGIRIPVLKSLSTQNELGWPFDSETCERWLKLNA